MLNQEVPRRRWAPALAAMVAFAVLGATAGWWALQLLAPPALIAPAGSLIDTTNTAGITPALALFGGGRDAAAAANPPVDDIRVLGVAAAAARGSAVLAIGTQPPRAWGEGEQIDDDLRLISVDDDRIVLERSNGRFTLPAPARPSIDLLFGNPAMPGAAANEPAQPPTP